MTGIKSIVFTAVLLVGVFGRIDAVTAGNNKEVATLAGGCFWCLEAIFEELEGVRKVESGFAGGDDDASYTEVCSGLTGHAEVVQITFDPAVISYGEILTVFFSVFLSRRRAESGGEKSHHRSDRGKGLARSGGDRGVPIRQVLQGRRAPSGLLPEQQDPGLLSGGDQSQTGQVPQAFRRPAEGLSLSGSPRKNQGRHEDGGPFSIQYV